VLGAGTSPTMVYYHQGSVPGYYSALLLFPETESAVVDLINSILLNDAVDWISRPYASALFQFPEPAEYVALAKEKLAKEGGKESKASELNLTRFDKTIP